MCADVEHKCRLISPVSRHKNTNQYMCDVAGKPTQPPEFDCSGHHYPRCICVGLDGVPGACEPPRDRDRPPHAVYFAVVRESHCAGCWPPPEDNLSNVGRGCSSEEENAGRRCSNSRNRHVLLFSTWIYVFQGAAAAAATSSARLPRITKAFGAFCAGGGATRPLCVR